MRLENYLKQETKEQYIERVLNSYSRAEMLKSLRMVGVSAGKIKDEKELAELLWKVSQEIQKK